MLSRFVWSKYRGLRLLLLSFSLLFSLEEIDGESTHTLLFFKLFGVLVLD